jgi:hypothetical protein
MSLDELFLELSKLNRQQMAQAIEFLQQQMEQNAPSDHSVYEVWSPEITAEGAHILREMLTEAKAKDVISRQE